MKEEKKKKKTKNNFQKETEINKKDLIVYEIYVKSFKDSNDDGVGDINGISQKLLYLKNLGVNCIWLTPIFKSPQFDNGYDISNYYQIDPLFGNMEDFLNLIKKAKKYNILIMLDMVLNHTSTQHNWFKKAIEGKEKYQNYYFFKNGNSKNNPPTKWKSKFGGNAWEYVPKLDKWYLHLFSPQQADVNWNNKEVRREIYKIINFWIDNGVNGFRFDVINLVSKPDDFSNKKYKKDNYKNYTDGKKIHLFLQKLRNSYYDKKNIFTVGEFSSTNLKDFSKYTNENNSELDMGFSFFHLKVDYKNGNKWVDKKPNLKKFKKEIIKWQKYQQKNRGWVANFLSNHDQPRHISRFGDDKNYHFESATAFATLYILLRGTPFIFNGEEIGQTNLYNNDISEFRDIESKNSYYKFINERKNKEEALKIINQKSRDNGRSPFAWNNKKYFGFSKSDPWILYKNPYKVTLENDLKNKEKSIFLYYQKIIKLRKENIVFKDGLFFSHNKKKELFIYKRIFNNKEYLVVINLTNKYVKYKRKSTKIILNNYKNEKSLNYLNPYQAIVFEI
ncbi:MAG: alpha,alpha-phosphotrehalase [Candidatus Hepatoplasma vulgare]|nr:MAG: alpha,alpha-phosphotrehalase [Candidatus Hepatoplasma sp.]